MSAPAAVTIENLGMRFSAGGGARDIFADVNLTIQPGEFFVIVGPSGCGKTTLLRIVQGLVQPTSGRVLVGDVPVTAPGTDRGFVFQQDSLYPWRTVQANVVFGLELQGIAPRHARARAARLIELVGLMGYERYYPHQLSGGMRQRVNLARAMAIEPQTLLMDEPFAALDALTRAAMQQELLRIVATAKTTVIFITHQIEEAVLLADRVAVMNARPGRISRVVTIDFPRPRDPAIKHSGPFQKYAAEIEGLIGHAD